MRMYGKGREDKQEERWDGIKCFRGWGVAKFWEPL